MKITILIIFILCSTSVKAYAGKFVYSDIIVALTTKQTINAAPTLIEKNEFYLVFKLVVSNLY